MAWWKVGLKADFRQVHLLGVPLLLPGLPGKLLFLLQNPVRKLPLQREGWSCPPLDFL